MPNEIPWMRCPLDSHIVPRWRLAILILILFGPPTAMAAGSSPARAVVRVPPSGQPYMESIPLWSVTRLVPPKPPRPKQWCRGELWFKSGVTGATFNVLGKTVPCYSYP